MNKETYLKILQIELEKINYPDIYEIINDYRGFFEEGMVNGKNEFEISKNLGDPRELVRQLQMDMPRYSNVYDEEYIYNTRKTTNNTTDSIGDKFVKAFGIFMFIILGIPIIFTAIVFLLTIALLGIVLIIAGVYVLISGNVSTNYFNGVITNLKLSFISTFFLSIAFASLGGLILVSISKVYEAVTFLTKKILNITQVKRS